MHTPDAAAVNDVDDAVVALLVVVDTEAQV